MKKLLVFFVSLILLVLTGVAIYFAGGIFDAGVNQRVYPFFFQPNNLSSQRPGAPQTPEYIGDSEFRDMLVRKYITEYFFASPDAEDIAKRTSSQGTLSIMSSQGVFEGWLNNEAVTIQKLAEDKSMRTVKVIDKIFQPNGSKYWIVNYELKTWEKPNDFSVAPTITRGTLYMDIYYEPGFPKNADIEKIHNYLEEGGDPASVFDFKVNRIIQG